MKAFARHLGFEFRTGIRDRSQLLMNYLFPLAFYVLMGGLMGQVNPAFLGTLIPSMSVVAVMSGTLLGLPGALVTAREAGIFRTYRINGVPALSILVIPLLTGMVHSLLVTGIVAVTAPTLFHAAWPTNWVGFVVVFGLSALAFGGLAALIGVVSTTTQMTVMLSQLIFVPSMVLGGLMLPTAMLPAGLVRLAWLLPTTYAMNGFGSLAMGQPATFGPLPSLAILAVGGALAFGLAAYLFTWDSRNPVRRVHPALALLAFLPYLAGALSA